MRLSSKSMEPGPDGNVTIKKIANGYLSTHSGMTGKGRNARYKETHFYHPTNPLAGGGKMPMKGKKKM